MFSGGLKLSDDEDDGFTLGPENGPSNLSNIFGVAVDAKEAAPSLCYVSPKQTENLEKNANHSQDWKVQVAKVVTAYKLLNNENISQGKIGLAVLKNSEEQLRIILYRSKNNVLSTYTLKDDSIVYRNNTYLQFNDDLQLFWSILFEPDDIKAIIDILGGKITIQVQQKSDIMSEENSSDERLQNTKAKILSRMAKMGQPLPKLPTTATTTDLSDSSDMETKIKVIQKPTVTSRKPKVQSLCQPSAASMQVIPSTAMSGLVPFVNTNFPQDPQYLSNVLLAENRTQNTELRINISKLETKIEKVLDKIEIIGSKASDERHDNKDDEIIELEEKILDLKKQNRTLKLQLREVEEKNRHSTFVCDGPSKLIEQSPPSELQKQLIHDMTTEIQSLKDTVKQQNALLEDSNSKLQNVNVELEEAKNQLNEQRINYERNIETVRQELTNAKRDNEALSKVAREQPSAEGLVKEIMNNLYQRLSQQFQENDQFSAIEVTKICANAIKAETNNVIKRM